MNEMLEELISALRIELQEYGEMLARLDQQQELVMQRRPEQVLHNVPQVQEQAENLRKIRHGRAEKMKILCRLMLLPEGSNFNELIPHLPAPYRPLMQALVQENNSLLTRVQQRVGQNHILLSRTIESLQSVIQSLTCQKQGPVYSGTGNVTPMPAATPALYEAVC